MTAAEPPGDTVALHGLRVRGYHGVFAQERADGQEFVVDAVLELDLAAAGASDRLADTVDYGALADRLADVVAGPPVQLLETLATRLAGTCLADPRVQAATVTVHKPQAPVAQQVVDVAVTRRLARTASGDAATGGTAGSDAAGSDAAGAETSP